MDRQYGLINQCLELVKQSKLSTCQRLRVEIQLIQIKRLLLIETISAAVSRGAFGDDLFHDLLVHVQNAGGVNGDDDSLTGFIDKVGGIVAELGGQFWRPSVAFPGKPTISQNRRSCGVETACFRG